jgi:Reverse transcriptase (RNA-dependent DNA polymerase)
MSGSQHLLSYAIFRKAYDTVDRSFLIQAFWLLGAGPRFLRMLVGLLTGRRSQGHANGYLSQRVSFAAGVPQGCPLSPALYLVIGQALSRWLPACGIGIAVAGMQLPCTQYADDNTAYLPSLASLPAFLAVMLRFGRATGQRLNTSKTVRGHGHWSTGPQCSPAHQPHADGSGSTGGHSRPHSGGSSDSGGAAGHRAGLAACQ